MLIIGIGYLERAYPPWNVLKVDGGGFHLPNPFIKTTGCPSLSDYPTGIQEGNEKLLLVASHECELVK